MNMVRHVLVTGSAGAIGSSVSKKFKEAGYLVCGIDQIAKQDATLDYFIQADLNDFVVDNSYRNGVINAIANWLGQSKLDVLVNNAAYQYVSLSHPIPVAELTKSYNVNVIAPYLLVTELSNILVEKTASIVNIGSIHSRLTKPGFISYATTKAALAALTRGLALDFENRIRINCIEPASVETPMLLDGFKDSPRRKIELESYYPQKRISTPDEIAELAYLISSDAVRFLHGSCIDMSGGIGCRLHDPV
jgi:NAD(P)-dependent dehydrogenase (short-subunit alcohol dehydrogenase family)